MTIYYGIHLNIKFSFLYSFISVELKIARFAITSFLSILTIGLDCLWPNAIFKCDQFLRSLFLSPDFHELWLSVMIICLLTEVKRQWATLVLGWVTVWVLENMGNNDGVSKHVKITLNDKFDFLCHLFFIYLNLFIFVSTNTNCSLPSLFRSKRLLSPQKITYS